ncbi:MAG TPA: CAP domain-containing protein [Planctomycetota bacterium]|nr:CAP domain-containing protein [Planctomycetota bacterium]
MRNHSEKLLHRGLLCAVLVLTLGTIAADATPSPEEQALIDATNQQRMNEGLEPLKANETLMKAARDHSANMAKQNILSHELDGKGAEDRIKELGYEFFTVGENVAYNDASPQAAVDSWMQSPGHRANILKRDFTEIGVGIVKNEQGEPYYTQVFGRPRTAGPTSKATIRITNQSEAAVKITLPGSNASSLLQPGVTGSYTVAGTGDLPKARAQVGDKTREFEMKDGAHYVVRCCDREEGVQVSVKPPSSEER